MSVDGGAQGGVATLGQPAGRRAARGVRLDLVWDSQAYAAGDEDSAPAVAMLFDQPAVDGHANAVAADQLLTWESRVRVEADLANIIAALRLRDDADPLEVGGFSVLEYAEYDLRYEWVNVLRGFELGRQAAARWQVGEVVGRAGCPTAIVAGIRAGAGLTKPLAAEPWLGLAPASREKAFRPRAADAILRGVERARGVGDIRIAAAPAGTVGPALLASPRRELRELGLGLMTFPGLDPSYSARLALRLGLPGVATGAHRQAAVPQMSLPAGLRLHEDPLLDDVLRAVANRVLAANVERTARAAASTRYLDRLPGLRSLLLHTGALGASRLLIDWAHRRGVRVAVVQHGFYSFREHDGADSRADAVFAWGPGVADQVIGWPKPRPEVIVSGAPRTPARASVRQVSSVRRVLVATTNAPIASSLGLFGFCDSFIAAIASGVARLQAAGVTVELRPHPQESRESYERTMNRLGIRIPFAPDESFAAAAGRCDLLVSSTSSVAYEAGALGMPVMIWTGTLPMDVSREHLLPPWDEAAPVRFADADQFDRLAARVIDDPAVVSEALAYGRRLAEFVEPFDAERFVAGLRRLAA